jgi:ubiquinone/menaquinone biosynthesis C-methylase UbiE
MATFHPSNDRDSGADSAPGNTATPPGSNFVWHGGRRYFAHAPYLLPMDDQEFTRQDFEHHLLRQALKANVLAPVGKPQTILDVGIGTGRWALETATQYPGARVVGLDLTSPPTLQSTEHDVLAIRGDQGKSAISNFSFVAGNILSSLPFKEGAFDYVHMRFLSAAIPLAHWRHVMSELARVTRRGGWIEVVDTSWTPLYGGPATEQLFHWARIAGMVHEINLQVAAWIGSLFLDSGLGNVTAPKLQLPMGRKGGRVGSMVAANAIAVAEAIQPWIVGYNIATEEACKSTLEGVRAEVMEGTCAYPLFVSYGQRV